MRSCLAVTDEGRIAENRIQDLLALLAEALNYEDQAMNCFRIVSARHPDLKRAILPRWGSHIPR